MRSIHRFLAAALCGALGIAAQAEKVPFEELPLELRDKIRTHSGNARIDDIDREVRGGKTVYEIAFEQNGKNVELRLDDRGSLIEQAGQIDSRKLVLSETPEAVRKTIETRLRGAVPNDIDRQVRNGDVSYEVGFKLGDRQHEIVVSRDGRILRDYQLSDSSLAVAGAATLANASAIPLSNKRKVSFDSLPGAVRSSIVTAAKGARIEEVERGHWRARTIYEAAFKDQGQHIELQVEENGRVLHDPRLAPPVAAAGAPAASATGVAVSSLYPDVTGAVPLSAGSKVDRAALPPAVERGIVTHAPGAAIEDIERGAWNGKNIYQIAFKQDGRHVELQLDEQGNIVFDPRKRQ